jgi:hypothetical protein
MDKNNLIQQLENQKEEEEEREEEEVEGVPVCDANLVSPVTDTANFIGEVHYKIGTGLYIEHTD